MLLLVQFLDFLDDTDGNIERVHIKLTGDTMPHAIEKKEQLGKLGSKITLRKIKANY